MRLGVLLVLFWPALAFAQPSDPGNGVAASESLLRRFVRVVYNGGATDSIGLFFTENFTQNDAAYGVDELAQDVVTLRSAFPDLACNVDHVIASDTQVAARLFFTGTHRGKYGKWRATNRKYRWAVLVLLEIDGDKFGARWVGGEEPSLSEQLGR